MLRRFRLASKLSTLVCIYIYIYLHMCTRVYIYIYIICIYICICIYIFRGIKGNGVFSLNVSFSDYSPLDTVKI